MSSHGRATIERGFSTNKEVSTENISAISLEGRRQICQAVKEAGGVCNVPVTAGMLNYASSARAKCRERLKVLEKEKEEANALSNKRKADKKIIERETSR